MKGDGEGGAGDGGEGGGARLRTAACPTVNDACGLLATPTGRARSIQDSDGDRDMFGDRRQLMETWQETRSRYTKTQIETNGDMFGDLENHL